jgi:hypothetical protein
VAIHIGELIRNEVELKRLTYKEFGLLIYLNEKTIPDIYDRESMQIDLLLRICKALNKDFFAVYYTEEPLKSIRNDEVAQLSLQLQSNANQLHKLTEENKILTKELNLTRDLNDALRIIISFAKEKIADLQKVNNELEGHVTKDNLYENSQNSTNNSHPTNAGVTKT